MTKGLCEKCGAPKENEKCSFCGFISEEKNNSIEIYNKVSIADMDFFSGNYSKALERYEKIIDESPTNLYIIYRRAVSQFYVNEIDANGKIRGDFNNYFNLFGLFKVIFDKSDSRDIHSEIRNQSKKILSIANDHRTQFFLKYKSLGIIDIIDSKPYDNFSGDYNNLFEIIIYCFESDINALKSLLNESIYFKKSYFLELLSAYVFSSKVVEYSIVENSLRIYFEYLDSKSDKLFSFISKYNQNHLLIILNYLVENRPNSDSTIKNIFGHYLIQSNNNEKFTDARVSEKIYSESLIKASLFFKNSKEINELINNFNVQRNQINEKKLDSKSTPCFIATATMGSYDHPVVMDLRLFRDNWLLKRNWGVVFTKWYYTHGPKAAKVIEKSNFLKRATYILIVKPLQLITKKMR